MDGTMSLMLPRGGQQGAHVPATFCTTVSMGAVRLGAAHSCSVAFTRLLVPEKCNNPRHHEVMAR